MTSYNSISSSAQKPARFLNLWRISAGFDVAFTNSVPIYLGVSLSGKI
jgi:hypothetical protein